LSRLKDSAGQRVVHGDFGLTPREKEIVSAAVAGYTNKEIAKQFSIREQTVKNHLTNIFDKIGVFNRLELAIFALHHGLIKKTDGL
jgi:two-component system nitrate/nitrite response regulator NarL